MEIIRKKICLEDFISRIPSNLDILDLSKTNSVLNNGSWGKIPKKFLLNDKYYNYNFIMELYYKIMGIITDATFYIYLNNKWVLETYSEGKTWKDFFKDSKYFLGQKIVFSNNFPTTNISNETIVGITNNNEIEKIKEDISIILLNPNFFNFINEINRIIGKYTVDESCEGIFVPFYLYEGDEYTIRFLYDKMTSLKDSNNCCNQKMYEDYGSDCFYNVLQNALSTNTPEEGDDNTETSENPENNNELDMSMPTIDIPILITSKLLDLGQFKSYDIDVIDETINTIDNNTEKIEDKYIITTKDESKIKTLRQRKKTFDDEGNLLPFNLNTNNQPVLPYKVLYVKNIQGEGSEGSGTSKTDYIIGDGIVNISYNDDRTKIIFTYVIGGRFKIVIDNTTKKPKIDSVYGMNPFINEDGNIIIENDIEYGEKVVSGDTNMYGIWYQESFPLKKDVYTFKYNDNDMNIEVETIDFDSKTYTYSYPGIDYDRKGYILCDNVKYLSSYINENSDKKSDLFFDEKMLGLSVPLKEEYNVIIDRGAISVFEKHLQLSEIKSWNDLENYRNGMFLNK